MMRIPKLKYEEEVSLYAKTQLPTEFGIFDMYVFREFPSNKEDVVVSCGNIFNRENLLVRIHSECFTGEVLHSLKCDCKGQLALALKMIQDEGEGLLIYLRQEGRGIGLGNKIKAYALQEEGIDTVDANIRLGFPIDSRSYKVAAQILKYFRINSVRLITNNPQKIRALEEEDIRVLQRIPCIVKPNQYSSYYLETKKKKMGHLL